MIPDYIDEYARKNLTEKRLKHTIGVVEAAKELAKLYGEDEKKAEIAATLHDIYRGRTTDELNDAVIALKLDRKRYMDNPNLSHGKIAAEMIQVDLDIKDCDIINAVSYHTTGRAGMSLLEKIIFIADATEPGRDYPGVEDIRTIAGMDIDKACLLSINGTIRHLEDSGIHIDEDTLLAKSYFEEIIKEA